MYLDDAGIAGGYLGHELDVAAKRPRLLRNLLAGDQRWRDQVGCLVRRRFQDLRRRRQEDAVAPYPYERTCKVVCFAHRTRQANGHVDTDADSVGDRSDQRVEI